MHEQVVQNLAVAQSIQTTEVIPSLWAIILLAAITFGVGMIAYVFLQARSDSQPPSAKALATGVAWVLLGMGVVMFAIWQAKPHFESRQVESRTEAIAQTQIGEDPASPDRLNPIVELGPDATVSVTRIEDSSDDSRDDLESDNADAAEDEVELSTPTVPLPKWITEPVGYGNDIERVTVSSQRFATIGEADEDALLVAAAVVTDYVRKRGAYTDGTSVPEEEVAEYAVLRRFVETFDHDFGPVTGEMHRVHLQVGLSSEMFDNIAQPWQEKVSGRRLTALGCLLALLTLILGATTLYLRLDAATQGAYRHRLKFAALSLVGAGGIVTGVILRKI